MDSTLKYRPHLEAMRKKLSARNSLLRLLTGLEWGAKAETICTTA